MGIAISLVMLSTLDPANARSGIGLDRLLIVQPILIGTLLLGFRHAVRVPAELRANWVFRLTWRDEQPRYLAGAKRAAFVGLVLPGVAIVFPLCAAIIGVRAAAIHAALGAASSMAMLDALFLRYDKVPFACSYVPAENMKALGPLYALLFFIGASTLAAFEADALHVPPLALALLIAFAVVSLALKHAATHRRGANVDFDEAPDSIQRLGLHT
jgi:hypothetical protein